MLTVGEFRAQFGEEAQCAEQLIRQRWPEGFRCPRCAGSTRGYIASRKVHECKLCAYQCSVTAGTIFHKTRTPLTSWFWAIYRMSHDKKGISAVQLMKEIGVSYVTAWTMQHKIRKAMEDRDQRYKLHGIIEMDEGYVGGAESGEGRRGRGAESKCVVGVAVEHAAVGEPGRPSVPGFAALQVLPDASSKSIDSFLEAKVAPGSEPTTKFRPNTSSATSPSSTTGSTEEPWNRTCRQGSSEPALEPRPLHFNNLPEKPGLTK